MVLKEEPGSLHRETLNLLLSDDRSIPTIYRESNIPYYWLKKFREGVYKNPSVNRVQRLYEFLTDTKLLGE